MIYLLHKHPCRARSCCHYAAIEINAVFLMQPKQLHSCQESMSTHVLCSLALLPTGARPAQQQEESALAGDLPGKSKG